MIMVHNDPQETKDCYLNEKVIVQLCKLVAHWFLWIITNGLMPKIQVFAR